MNINILNVQKYKHYNFEFLSLVRDNKVFLILSLFVEYINIQIPIIDTWGGSIFTLPID